MNGIPEVVEKIIAATEKQSWATVDRLTLVLKELVKVEIAAIQGKKSE